MQIVTWGDQIQSGTLIPESAPHKVVPQLQNRVQQLLTANITSYGPLEDCAPLLVAYNRVVFIQEHHLLGSKLQAAMQQLARQGIKAWLSEANATPKLGTSGGVGLLWGPGTHLIGHPQVIVPGRATAAIFDVPKLEHIMCVTIYGNTYSSENTISIVEQW